MAGGPADMRAVAEEMLEEHRLILQGYLRHLLASPHDAADVLQEIRVSALENPAMLLRGADPGAYLRGIARHLASRHIRAYRRALALESFIEAVWTPERDDPEVDERERGALRLCLKELSGKRRKILAWRYEGVLNASQIAGRLGLSSDAVRMALARIRQALARCIRKRLVPGREATQ